MKAKTDIYFHISHMLYQFGKNYHVNNIVKSKKYIVNYLII